MLERTYTFPTQMRMREGASNKTELDDILLEHFPNATKVERATSSEDRNGTDRWITMHSGEKESVDVKVREEDWLKKRGQDDVALEIWSVMGKKVGWTRDTTKRTNWIFFLWKDTGRNMLVPFPMLCSIFIEHWEEWSKIFFSPIQRTPYAMGGYYKSQCVYVPRTLIWKEIYKVYGGASQRNVNPDALLIDGIQRAKDRSYATTRIEKPKLTDRERTIIDSFPVQEGLWT